LRTPLLVFELKERLRTFRMINKKEIFPFLPFLIFVLFVLISSIVIPFSYLSGAVSRNEYLENYRREYPVMQYINDNLPAESLILFIFLGNRGYYCDRN
jgi:hypothetical protein